MNEPLQRHLGAHTATNAWHGDRSATVQAGFFLPLLKPGMRLLDLGAGLGNITLGLAVAVAPAEVVGIDVESR
ncbi:MAG: SAM-dependent methyltransferase, partial [Chloroflexota bacterium]